MVISVRPPRGSSAALFAALLTVLPAAAANEPAVPDYVSQLRRKVMLEGAGGQRFGIEERMRHYGVPAVSIAVVDGCEVVDARAFGQALPDGTAAHPGTRFMAGSVSKVVASAGALKLVADGTLSLDDDVSRYLRTWTLPRPAPFDQGPVTLRQLLSHSAGLTVAGFKGYATGSALPSLTQVLDGMPPANTAPVRLDAEPGVGWRYSGGGFVLTQLLMEEASRVPFQDLMRDRVLGPAGMHRSSYQSPSETLPVVDVAGGTLADGKPIPGGWRLYPEQAAAGLWSTPTDLSRFGIALTRSLRGEDDALLTARTANEMMRRQAGAWGLGVELSPDGAPRKFSHTGAPVGYRTLWLMFPDTCQGATIMTNADEGMALTHEVARAIADQYGWPDPMASERASFVPLTDEMAARFIGTYQLRDFPSEHFEVERLPDGTVTWARQGRGRKALAASSPNELLSPDSGMRLVAVDRTPGTGVVNMLELHFPGGGNIARRVEVLAQPAAL